MAAQLPTWSQGSGFVVAPTEPFGVWKAAQNVRDDFSRAAGFEAAFSRASTDVKGLPVIAESDAAIATRLNLAQGLSWPEAFIIRLIKLDGRDAILISARDERGAIFGLYHFSEMQLGTDPFQFWTGWYPPAQNPLILKPIDFDSPKPTFRYRGLFLEGIHAITGWRSPDMTVGYEVFYEKAFETMLRAKCNMTKPNTNVPESMEVGLAQRMGILVTQEHCCACGIGMFFDPPYPGFKFSYTENRETFLRAWEDAIRRYPRPENVIWTLAMRGRDDRGFWFDDPTMPKVPTDQQKGEIITRAIHDQKELITRVHGKHNPVFIHNLWMEGVRLYREGHIKPPEGTLIVWADNGYGSFRAMLAAGCNAQQMCDARPEKPAGGTQGSYYHVSMWDYNTPFYTQFVPPERIQREYSYMIGKEATAYALANAGRLRNCLMGAAAFCEMSWQAGKWADPQSDAAEDFMQRWCRRHFGKLAGEVRECYRALYTTPIKHGEWGGWDDLICGDIGYVRRVRILVNRCISLAENERYAKPEASWRFFMNRPMTVKEAVDYLKPKTTEAAAKWERAHTAALSVAERLHGPAREFFTTDVLAQIELNRHLNEFLDTMLDAVALYLERKCPEVRIKVARAREQLEKARGGLARMVQGRWSGWYDLQTAVPFPTAEQACRALATAAEEVQRGE